MVKNRKKLILAVSAAAAFAFAFFALVWLAFSGAAILCIDMPGGSETELEYSQPYKDDVRAYLRLPLSGKELPLPLECSSLPDNMRLGRYRLCYTTSFMGKSFSRDRYVTVVDTTAPRIKLESRPGYRADWFEGYVEEGYEATDGHDGDLSSKVIIKCENGIVSYTVSDSSGNTATAQRRIDYAVPPPHISLQGGSSLELCPMPYFAEPGYSARDEQGRDYSSLVTVSGQVQSSVPGEYELVYTLTNPAGDTVSVKRSVTVSLGGQQRNMAEGKVIYLSFDDGPGPYTDALLDVLEAYGAKATFFVTGANSRCNDCIGRAYREGHSIGAHSYSHSYGYIYASEENFFRDFAAVQQLIFEQTGEYTPLVRFPGGSSNTVSRFNPGIMSRLGPGLESMGYRYFDWNVNSRDAEGARSASAVAENIIRGCHGKNCAVVLQHDIKAFSVEAVEQVLIWGLENGYSFLPLDVSSPVTHHDIAN